MTTTTRSEYTQGSQRVGGILSSGQKRTGSTNLMSRVDGSPGMFKLFGKEAVRSKYYASSSAHLTDALQQVLVNSSQRAAVMNLEFEEKCSFHPRE